MSSVGLVILAAGGSTRLGTPKQLLHNEGISLLRRAAQTAVASACRPIVVVLGASMEACLAELEDLPVSPVENADWEEGMSASLRLGMEHLLVSASGPLDAAIVMLCDQPLLTTQHLEALLTAYRAARCLVVASEYGDTIGVPVLFDASLFPELLRLKGAHGAKQILARYPHDIQRISFPDGAVDVDTAADYARLSRL